MSGNTVFIIIAVVIGGAILAAIAYYIARFLRGSIKLLLPVTAYNPGESIVGSFDLLSKKAIQGNKLIVSLIGMRVTTTRKDGETDTDSDEIYRDEVLVEGAREYPAGFAATYNFEILIPNSQSPEFLNSTAGKALSTAFSLLSNNSTELKWSVEARLDAKGVDLAKKQPVTVNINQFV